MLRECHRVLEPGGLIGGYVIHTPGGLTAPEQERAATLGPSAVLGGAAPEELLRSAGFRMGHCDDVTRTFRNTTAAMLRARGERETELRMAEGDELFEQEMDKKCRMLEGIDAGLLVRSVLVGVKA